MCARSWQHRRKYGFWPPYRRPKRSPLSGNVAQARRRARWATPTPARVRSRQVWRTLKTIYNESVFFTCWHIGDSLRKKQKCDFLENLSSDFRKISYQRAPHTALPNDITSDPSPSLGAGPGGPKIWVDTPKISHLRFSRVEIFSTGSSARWSPQKFGV